MPKYPVETEPFEIQFPPDRQWFTTGQSAVLIGLTETAGSLIILLAAKYDIPNEDIGRSVIFSRKSVIALRAALLEYRKKHPRAGAVRGPNRSKSKARVA